MLCPCLVVCDDRVGLVRVCRLVFEMPSVGNTLSEVDPFASLGTAD